MNEKAILVIFIPFVGTIIGAATVFLFRGKMNATVQKCFLGFASGVMIAACVWSLLIPSIELSEGAWMPAALGFLAGNGFLLLLDYLIPHLHVNSDIPEGRKSKFEKNTMLVLAITLHNIPEGMAVGVLYASLLAGSTHIMLPATLALSIGIALQNIPEGAVVSMPFLAGGMSRGKAFFFGAASGAVEPIAALITIALTAVVTPVLPYILAFAAGAMLYVVVEELIPDAHGGKHSNAGSISAALGFVLMMVLDIALG
ncbi:MAG: ZIP family metal transporter [Oscillospiraceae bacterium]|nr:ZIP family metal transporter [Oscillospiraceae bacterium]